MLLLVAVGAALTACGSSSDKTTATSPAPTPAVPTANALLTPQPSTPATATSPTAAASTPTTSGAPKAGNSCATSQLDVSYDQGQGAAGTEFSGITFRNRSLTTCTLQGYPGVSLLDKNHKQIGEPATRVRGSSPVVALAPGQAGTATFTVTPAACSDGLPQQSAYLRVFPPNQRADVVISAQAYACRPQIRPVQPGTSLSAD